MTASTLSKVNSSSIEVDWPFIHSLSFARNRITRTLLGHKLGQHNMRKQYYIEQVRYRIASQQQNAHQRPKRMLLERWTERKSYFQRPRSQARHPVGVLSSFWLGSGFIAQVRKTPGCHGNEQVNKTIYFPAVSWADLNITQLSFATMNRAHDSRLSSTYIQIDQYAKALEIEWILALLFRSFSSTFVHERVEFLVPVAYFWSKRTIGMLLKSALEICLEEPTFSI